jgi:hypothetical protein
MLMGSPYQTFRPSSATGDYHVVQTLCFDQGHPAACEAMHQIVRSEHGSTLIVNSTGLQQFKIMRV